MRISILIDNNAKPGFLSEWGFACSVETGDGMIVWDTGESAAFIENSLKMGLDLGKADKVALSHGHYDHTGGLPSLKAAGFDGPVHAHPDFNTERFSFKYDPPESIGLKATVSGVVEVRESMELLPGVTMLTDIPRLPGNPEMVDGFCFDREGNKPDHVNDDAFLVLETAKGPVILLGCCHAGLENSLEYASARLGHNSFYGIIGGMHLYASEKSAYSNVALACRKFGVQMLAPGHCSGEHAPGIFKQILPELEIHPLHSGMVLEFS